MGHEHERLFVLEQEILEPKDGSDVEMVCGLVEEQHVRFAHQGPGQKDPAFHARGQKPELGILVQTGPCDHRFHPLVILPGARCLYPVLGLFEGSEQTRISLPRPI